MAGEKICPHCGSTVVPIAQAPGQLLCPLCGNTGIVRQQPAPAAFQPAPPPGFAPAPAAQAPAAPGWAPVAENAPGAVAALVMGIIALVIPYVGFVTAFFALHFGKSAMALVDANPGRYAGRGMAQTGRILGIVALCIYGLIVLTILLAAAVFVAVSRATHGP